MRVSRNDLEGLGQALDNVGNLTGIKFAYAVAKNRDKITSEMRRMQKGLEPTEAYSKYDTARLALCKEHCKKDDKGGAVTMGRSFIGLENNDEFEAAMEELQKEHQETVDERKKLLEEYEKEMKEEVEWNFHMIRFSSVPKNITAGQLTGIIKLVEDGDVDSDKDEDKESKPE